MTWCPTTSGRSRRGACGPSRACARAASRGSGSTSSRAQPPSWLVAPHAVAHSGDYRCCGSCALSAAAARLAIATNKLRAKNAGRAEEQRWGNKMRGAAQVTTTPAAGANEGETRRGSREGQVSLFFSFRNQGGGRQGTGLHAGQSRCIKCCGRAWEFEIFLEVGGAAALAGAGGEQCAQQRGSEAGRGGPEAGLNHVDGVGGRQVAACGG